MAAQSPRAEGKTALGRRRVRRILQQEAYRRIIAGDTTETLSEFAAQLSAWFKDAFPVAAAVSESLVEDAIRDTWHRRHEMIGIAL